MFPRDIRNDYIGTYKCIGHEKSIYFDNDSFKEYINERDTTLNIIIRKNKKNNFITLSMYNLEFFIKQYNDNSYKDTFRCCVNDNVTFRNESIFFYRSHSFYHYEFESTYNGIKK